MEKIIKKINIDKCLMILAIGIFCLITIPKLLNHFPWFDEAHAWMVAKEMNIHNFIARIRGEGHFIIWYALLMPFSKLNLWYPLSMKFLNWGFYLLAILVMWRKAPFNSLIKTIITLSWVSLNYYSIIARCYSIGILGLFLLAALYNEKTKKPILYSILLILTAHTSILATFAIIPLGLIFVYEMIEVWKSGNKKDVIISSIILILGGILWIYPYLKGYGTETLLEENRPSLNNLYLYFKAYKCTMGISYILCSLLILLNTDNKVRFFLIMTITEFLIFFGLIYCVYPHHIVFMYIYMIIALWLTPKLQKWNSRVWVFIIIFAILSNINMENRFKYCLNNSNKYKLVKYLNEQKPKYLIVAWRYADMEPLLSEDIKIMHIYDLKRLYKEHPDDLVEHLIMTYIPNDDKYDLIILNERKLNENSAPFKIKTPQKKKKTVYLTKIERNI